MDHQEIKLQETSHFLIFKANISSYTVLDDAQHVVKHALDMFYVAKQTYFYFKGTPAFNTVSSDCMSRGGDLFVKVS